MAYTSARSAWFRKIIAALIIITLSVTTTFILGSVSMTDDSTYGLLINDSVYINGTLIVADNVSADNVYEAAYIYAHTNGNLSIATASVWYNASFTEGVAFPEQNMKHNHSDVTNDTFTIVDDGIYAISWSMRYLDIAPAPDAVVATRILKNTCCINGSYFEKDTTKQNAVGSIHHRTIDSFVTNDTIKLQVASTDTTVRFGYNCTMATHCDTFVMDIKRIS